MKIGELARATATPIETIRYYEQQGLIDAAARTGSNYRVYVDAHIERLAFIRRCRSLDMSLNEIRLLLRYKDAPLENCAGVSDLIEAHIGHVAGRIEELESLKHQLEALRQSCTVTEENRHCGILSELSNVPRPEGDGAKNLTGHVHGAHG